MPKSLPPQVFDKEGVWILERPQWQPELVAQRDNPQRSDQRRLEVLSRNGRDRLPRASTSMPTATTSAGLGAGATAKTVPVPTDASHHDAHGVSTAR